MSLSRHEFAQFYAAVNAGRRPFDWQERLLDHLLTRGRWPDQIAAPTGAGKTSAIDVHVFAVALTSDLERPRLPRRLAMVVGRRVLVDDQLQRAEALAETLCVALRDRVDDVVGRVAQRLAVLRWPSGPAQDLADADPVTWSPLVVARLRGGLPPSRSWRDHPTACGILCATPDMWGSRLLFRGYGTSEFAAPREAGVLAFDCAVVVDEAHLSGQLLVTARRVGQLVAAAERPLESVPGLQVVETSATPATEAEHWTSVSVENGDLADDVLAHRLTRPKPVTLLPVSGWPPPGRKPGKPAEALVQAVVRVCTTLAAPNNQASLVALTVGCFANSVPMAVAVADQLRKTRLAGRALRVVMVCGQTRPADLQRLRERYPGVLTPAGNSEVDVIVATQSLEVGVDIDLAAIVTELASGSALAQRAGRANRRGLRPDAPITVVVPTDPMSDRTRTGPYQHEELSAALDWIIRRGGQADGLAPWALRSDQPPVARPRRILYQRPELADTWHWARTSEDLAAEPELDLWLGESFDDETSVGVVVRDAVPSDPGEAIGLVRQLPPRPHEVFPASYATARLALGQLMRVEERQTQQTDDGRIAPIRVRGEEVSVLRTRTSAMGEEVPDIRPGDLVVLDSREAIFAGGTTRTAGKAGVDEAEGDFSPMVLATADREGAAEGLAASQRATADDVLHRAPARSAGEVNGSVGTARAGDVVLRLDLAAERRVAGIYCAAVRQHAKELADAFLAHREQDARSAHRIERQRRTDLVRFVHSLLGTPGACDSLVRPMVAAAADLLEQHYKRSDVIETWDATDELVRIAVIDRRRAGADEELRQIFSTSSRDAEPVTLDAHQTAVAARAELLARDLALPESMAAALRLAGAHHDDGKADHRFQIRLGAEPGGALLAKSDPGSTAQQARERESAANLPPRWRHEQASVVRCWTALAEQLGEGHGDDVDRLLVARLVGTSHGRGRSDFPHSGANLLESGEPSYLHDLAVEFFDRGDWDDLMERTQTRYGVWGCAYLEALLRAADGQISGEGS